MTPPRKSHRILQIGRGIVKCIGVLVTDASFSSSVEIGMRKILNFGRFEPRKGEIVALRASSDETDGENHCEHYERDRVECRYVHRSVC